MSYLKPCPVCGNRVDILRRYTENLKGGRDRVSYFFNHHPAPFGFCILQATLDRKKFTKKMMENLATIWNIRGEDCHTIGLLTDAEKVIIDD